MAASPGTRGLSFIFQPYRNMLDSRYESLKAASKSGPFTSSNYAYRWNARLCKSSSRVKVPFVIGQRRKLLKLSAFKSNSRNEESRGKPTGSAFLKNSIGLSNTPQESQASLTESLKPHSDPASSYPSESETAPGSLAIQNLFKSWLMLLQMPSENHTANGSAEKPALMETSETESKQKERFHIPKALWYFFWNLDVSITITLVTFVPLYVAVYLKYGAEVTKDLAPLWFVGPIISAVYIKLFQGIGALYVFSFKQTVQVIRNSPTYFLVAQDYIFSGKLNEIITNLFQPLIDMMNLFHKEELIRRMKKLQVHLMEKYLDFVESIWPYYCRTIRFLKRANLL